VLTPSRLADYCLVTADHASPPYATLMGVFEKIPTFLVVGVLVVIFVQLKRHARTPRLTLWTVGWALTFTHFLAQLLEPENGPASSLLLAIDSASLQAAAVSFLVSVSSVAAEKEDRTRRTLLLILLGLPSVVYMTCAAFQMGARWPYVLCLIAYLASFFSENHESLLNQVARILPIARKAQAKTIQICVILVRNSLEPSFIHLLSTGMRQGDERLFYRTPLISFSKMSCM